MKTSVLTGVFAKVLFLLLVVIVLLMPVLCRAQQQEENENHLAVDLWGLSYHGDRDAGYNERNWGLGLRAYHNNWFGAVDMMLNSVRGKALVAGVGYEYPFMNIGGYSIAAEAELAHVNYERPGLETARGWVLIPALSVRKNNISAHMVIVPQTTSQKGVLIFFLTYHFKSF